MPRQGSRVGRGNLSERVLEEFTLWVLKVCLDQITFSGLFAIDALDRRLTQLVGQSPTSKPEAARLFSEVLVRGEVARYAVARVTTLPERSARRVLTDGVAAGVLASETPKGSVSQRFPVT